MNRAGGQEYDAIIVGGNTAGLVSAYVLAQFGFRVALLERSQQVGGVDASFTNANGRIFDHGLHGLDYMRSPLVTRLFSKLIEGRAHKVERCRGIVLRNHLIPYNAELESWPEELRSLFPKGELRDGLATDVPNRSNLSKYYGSEFVDMIFDEGLPSYPSDHHHLQHGIDESQLVRDLYPWFFPRARRESLSTTLSRKYHDAARKARKEYVLYPEEGGFGGFAQALLRGLRQSGVDVILGAKDLSFDIDASSKYVRQVNVGGRSLSSPRVLWCAAASALYELLDRPAPHLKPDIYVIGSFEFEKPVLERFNEVIIADPQHRINRMTFPGSFAKARNDLVQVEFAFPRDSKEYQRDPGVWREDWANSLQEMGIVGEGNALQAFDFKTFPIYYNTFGIDGQPAPEIEFDSLPADSNLIPVLLTVKNVNINTRIPQIVSFLTEVMNAK
ncbi:MAG: FAD-dependent oxidoreductase [Planctomycetota bacterium]